MEAGVVVERAGWCRVVLPDTPEAGVMVRFGPDGAGHLRAVEVVAAAGGGVTPQLLRAVPLGRLEAWANGPGAQALRVRAFRRGRSAVDIDAEERETAAWRATWGTGDDAIGDPVAWLAEPHQDTLRVAVPEGRAKPDGFYRAVADAYGAAAAGGQPAQAMAEANGVPVVRVYAWVKEARRRGLMSAARRGVA